MKTKVITIISTMNRDDFAWLKDMQLKGEIVVINQGNREGTETICQKSFRGTVYHTTQRGLSRSRNYGVTVSNSEYFLIADDDIQYLKHYETIVSSRFDAYPEADIIAFNLERRNIPDNMMGGKMHGGWKKSAANRYYPSVCLAFRRSSFEQANLRFHPLFGSGSIYKSGEESLLLREARKRGLKIFESPEIIARVDFSESTWFAGYNERYLFDKGAWLRAAYPKTWFFLMFYFLKLKKKSTLSYGNMLRQMAAGARSYEKRFAYRE